MKTIRYYGKIEGGKLKIFRQPQFLEEVKTSADRDVEIIVKDRGRFTLPQNRYYRGIVVPTIRQFLYECGNRLSDEDVHLMLKLKFNPQNVHNQHGEVIESRPGSTTELNMTEMGAYIDQVIEWAREVLELQIPPPGQQTELFAA
jgi:hypothetical protein